MLTVDLALICRSGDNLATWIEKSYYTPAVMWLDVIDLIREKWEITPSNPSLQKGLLPSGVLTHPSPVIPPNARSPKPSQSNPGNTAWRCGSHLRWKSASRTAVLYTKVQKHFKPDFSFFNSQKCNRFKKVLSIIKIIN